VCRDDLQRSSELLLEGVAAASNCLCVCECVCVCVCECVCVSECECVCVCMDLLHAGKFCRSVRRLLLKASNNSLIQCYNFEGAGNMMMMMMMMLISIIMMMMMMMMFMMIIITTCSHIQLLRSARRISIVNLQQIIQLLVV